MKVLIDTNVALNYVLGRDDLYSKESESILKLCADGTLEGFIAFHSLSTIWYVTRKLPENIRRQMLRQLCIILTVAAADQQSVLQAIDNDSFKDFEDNLQDCCAAYVQADYIITGNVKDFDGVSRVTAIDPNTFLALISVES